ncbi:GyrI-like domain-containing protein [Niveibacterium terrae]|uniref:GyrI-like domain-containing protein n=1 Tax=Niveibacterium terrae TaxID=3373598 RepID=UPI003A916DEC
MQIDVRIATRENFPPIRLAGLIWEGSYAQAAAGAIGEVMNELRRRLALAPNARIIGVSWTGRPGGFRHFCGVEVGSRDVAADDLARIEIPSLICLSMPHRGGDATDAYAFLMAERDRLGLLACDDPSMIDELLEDGSMRLWLPVSAGCPK